MRLHRTIGGIFLYTPYIAILVATLLVSGCGTVERKVALDDRYSVLPGTKVELGPVSNETGIAFDIDIEKMLADALSQSLKTNNLQWTGGGAPKLVLTTNILGYAKGNAFERWARFPGGVSSVGFGSTTLEIDGALYDSENRKVGSATARRTVDFGGAFTIGAWETIFPSIADDVVMKLADKLK